MVDISSGARLPAVYTYALWILCSCCGLGCFTKVLICIRPASSTGLYRWNSGQRTNTASVSNHAACRGNTTNDSNRVSSGIGPQITAATEPLLDVRIGAVG